MRFRVCLVAAVVAFPVGTARLVARRLSFSPVFFSDSLSGEASAGDTRNEAAGIDFIVKGRQIGLRACLCAAGMQDIMRQEPGYLRNSLWGSTMCGNLPAGGRGLPCCWASLWEVPDGLQPTCVHDGLWRRLQERLRETPLFLEVPPSQLPEAKVPTDMQWFCPLRCDISALQCDDASPISGGGRRGRHDGHCFVGSIQSDEASHTATTLPQARWDASHSLSAASGGEVRRSGEDNGEVRAARQEIRQIIVFS
eukprot:CAMPEP_0177488750 /NCGR_PEP_ID=MMETSP0369-20130122/30330_1 /TAXON_ID=447022 ORGANISM="Scrippsiella hangoei-like, Strain SHHI-4" /NCGR_SAMPLE_ID=MMETSP0369 /ASSEMBLY_ACC=CAM_ASM_000364 /LENGTH=252 /DNA_ID=CAMNT_0018965155 /DNA_START=47 /DNA_END=804 /DNA_ORIENTATION=-